MYIGFLLRTLVIFSISFTQSHIVKRGNLVGQSYNGQSYLEMKSKLKDDEGGGGGASGGISEKQARQIIQAEFKKLDENMKEQNQQVMETLNNSTEENLRMLNESVRNMTIVVDKMVYHMDKRIGRLSQQLEDNIQQTEEMSFLIVQDQLEKNQEELNQLIKRIAELKEELGPYSAECDSYFSCSECQQNNKCGWCTMEEKCVLGDVDGPLYVSCNFYSYNYCSGKECQRYETCSSCLSDPECGWCNDEQRVMSGCIEQPGDYRGCPADGWFHIEGLIKYCPKHMQQLDQMKDQVEEVEDWARQDVKEKTKKKSKKQIEQEQRLYEEEKQRVLDERAAQIESITPAEKNKIKKKLQLELEEKEKRMRDVKKTVMKLQARLDEMMSRIQAFDDELELDEVEPEVQEDPEAEGEPETKS